MQHVHGPLEKESQQHTPCSPQELFVLFVHGFGAPNAPAMLREARNRCRRGRMMLGAVGKAAAAVPLTGAPQYEFSESATGPGGT